MAKVKTDRRVYELQNGTLSADVPGGQRARMFAPAGRELDGDDAARYRAFVASESQSSDEAAAAEVAAAEASAAEATAVEVAAAGHIVEPIVPKGKRGKGQSGKGRRRPSK